LNKKEVIEMEWRTAKKQAKRVDCEKELKNASFKRALDVLRQHPIEVPYGSFAQAGNEVGDATTAYQQTHLEAENKRALAIANFDRNKYRLV
jgi:hypothetical protein